jgi:hypothetical protein
VSRTLDRISLTKQSTSVAEVGSLEAYVWFCPLGVNVHAAAMRPKTTTNTNRVGSEDDMAGDERGGGYHVPMTKPPLILPLPLSSSHPSWNTVPIYSRAGSRGMKTPHSFNKIRLA